MSGEVICGKRSLRAP